MPPSLLKCPSSARIELHSITSRRAPPTPRYARWWLRVPIAVSIPKWLLLNSSDDEHRQTTNTRICGGHAAGRLMLISYPFASCAGPKLHGKLACAIRSRFPGTRPGCVLWCLIGGRRGYQQRYAGRRLACLQLNSNCDCYAGALAASSLHKSCL